MTSIEEIQNMVAMHPKYGYKDWNTMVSMLQDSWPLVAAEIYEEAFDIASKLLNEQEEDNERLRSNIMSMSTANDKYRSMLTEQINRLNDKFREKDTEISELDNQLEEMTKKKDDLYNELYELKNKVV